MHVQSIISAQDAFAALQAGKKNIVCRHINGEFDTLDQHPATAFFNPDYQFGFSIELIEVAGITFTKPLTFDDIQDGQLLYVINTYNTSIHVVEYGGSVTSALLDSIESGFAQRDAENAKLQLQAISCALGFELSADCPVVRIDEDKPKAKRTRKTKEEKLTEEVKADAPVADPEIVPDYFSDYSEKINSAQSIDEVTNLRYSFTAHHHLEREQVIQLSELADRRLTVIDPEQHPDPNTLPIDQEPDNVYDMIEQAKSVEYLEQVVAPKINEANGLLNDSAILSLKNSYAQRKEQLAQQSLNVEAEHQVDTVDPDEAKRSRTEQQIIAMAEAAVDARGANALIRYTTNWTEEQRKPVLDAINKRLVQLGEAHKPTLLERAKYAKSLKELEQIESEFGEMDSSHAMYFSIGKAIRDRRVDLGDINAI